MARPGDFYMFTKEAEGMDWAFQMYDAIKNRMTRPPNPLGPLEPPQLGPTEPPQLGTPGMGPASQFPRQLTRGQKLMSGAGSMARTLGKGLVTSGTQAVADAASRKAVEHMTGGGRVDEGTVARGMEGALSWTAPFAPLGTGVALSTVPAIGRLGGAALGTMMADKPVQFGPAADNHPEIKEWATAAPKTQDDLAAVHKKDPFAVSFGAGWNDGKTEFKLNPPKGIK